MRSTSGYALQEGFFHLFKRLTNESAEFPTDVNKVLARFGRLAPGLAARVSLHGIPLASRHHRPHGCECGGGRRELTE
jgi:hypothetical protein